MKPEETVDYNFKVCWHAISRMRRADARMPLTPAMRPARSSNAVAATPMRGPPMSPAQGNKSPIESHSVCHEIPAPHTRFTCTPFITGDLHRTRASRAN